MCALTIAKDRHAVASFVGAVGRVGDPYANKRSRGWRTSWLDGGDMDAPDQVRRERERCVQICRRRAELWRKTAHSGAFAAREEARARANEAAYLADLLATGEDVSD